MVYAGNRESSAGDAHHVAAPNPPLEEAREGARKRVEGDALRGRDHLVGPPFRGEAIPDLLEDADNGLSFDFRQLLAELYEELVAIDRRVAELTQRIERDVRAHDQGKRLLEISGIVPLTASALIAFAGRCLRRRRRYTFCLVVAAISCAFVPFGTVLGIFTLVVLTRPGVKPMFA